MFATKGNEPFTDKRKTELIDGTAYMMAPAGTWHNTIGGNLYVIIHNFLRKKRCKVFYETKLIFDEKNHCIPDLMIVCDKDKIKENHVEGAPDLVIEILSPSTRKRDLSTKKDTYEKFGVKEYWIVEPKAETIEVYKLQDGKLKLDNSYHDYTETELEGLEDDERAEALLTMKISLYDALEIELKDVFEK